VEVQVNTKVTDLNFDPATADILVNSLTIEREGEETQINVAPQDLVFLTNGSLVADATFGTMTEPPQFITGRVDGSWSLWEKLASLDPEFGNPQVFNAQPEVSAWESFTVTASSPKFIDQVEHLSHRKAGRGGLMTLTASNWLITFTLFHHPHFVDQPEDRFLWWGYGLFVHEHGNFIDKPMLECSGAEILEEVVRHLGFDDDLEDIIDTSVCIPAVIPYAGSVFMPRKQGDRPKVVPDRSRNLAFLGQFTEMPEDVVYTVEYSVRSAWTAVAELLDLDRRPPDVFKGEYDPRIVYEVLKTLQT
jgi:oleate hydratase